MYNIDVVVDALGTGAVIKYYRVLNHMTVSQLSEAVGLCSEQAVYKWQRGESLPSVDNLVQLCKIFNVTLDDLVQVKNIDYECNR